MRMRDWEDNDTKIAIVLAVGLETETAADKAGSAVGSLIPRIAS
jgi:hypothetical protein